MIVASTIVTYSSLVRVSQPAMLKPLAWPHEAETFAGIAFSKGDYDQAAELQRKVLEAAKQLGDPVGIARTNWDLAQIDLARNDDQAALPRLIESFQILGRLQQPDGVAVVGFVLGRLLLAVGQPDEARRVLTAAHAAAVKLGWTDRVQQISELFSQSAPPAEET